MNKTPCFTTLISLTLGIALAIGGSACFADTKPTTGDGSGIGGTGNSPGGSGIGGTGKHEQNLPDTMPDLPETPNTANVPEIQTPDIPSSVDVNGTAEVPPINTPETH